MCRGRFVQGFTSGTFGFASLAAAVPLLAREVVAVSMGSVSIGDGDSDFCVFCFLFVTIEVVIVSSWISSVDVCKLRPWGMSINI